MFSNERIPNPAQNKLIEERGSLNSRAMAKGIPMIVAHLNDLSSGGKINPIFKENIARNVAGLIKMRMSFEEADVIMAKFSPSQLKIYESTVALTKRMYAEKLGLNGQKGNGDSYWEVFDPTTRQIMYPETIKGPVDREAKIQRKEYFTFVPTSTEPDQLLQEIVRFYDALLRAFQKINQLGRAKGIRIIMKFEDNLRGLLADLDSAVLYVPDAEMGKSFRAIVNDEMAKKNVTLGKRSGRGLSGFDMKVGGKEFSHRQLLSHAVAADIEDDYKNAGQVASYNETQLAQHVLYKSAQASKLTPREMLEVI